MYFANKFKREAQEWKITDREDCKHHDKVESKMAPKELSNKQKNRLLAQEEELAELVEIVPKVAKNGWGKKKNYQPENQPKNKENKER